MEAQLAVVVVEGRVELVRPMDAAAIDDHHHLFAGFAEDCHHLMEILTTLLGIKVRDDFIEDFGGAILDSADDAEQHAPSDAAPRAVLHPRLPFVTFLLFDLALAQRACGQAIPLGAAPPAQPGQGKAPHDRFIFIEPDDLTSTCSVLEGGEIKSGRGEISRGGIELSSGTAVASRVFFKTPRTLSRPSWSPVCWASTVASSRQLHWEYTEPCSRGSWSTRRLRCCSNAQVTLGGRPERGRSTSPCVPWVAKRWTHFRSAE